MFDVGASLQPALARAQQSLTDASAAIARATARGGAADEAMAQTAKAAIFQEALVSAVHARLAEVKQAAR